MPNHVHLLLSASTPEKLVRFMHQVQRRYWFHMRRKYRLFGHLWQGRYHSFPIESESYLLEAGRYIERNPLRAEIVQRAEDYPWSSYRHYALGEKDPLIDDDPYYAQLGPDQTTRQQCYQEFIRTGGPYDTLVDQSFVETHF